jgi:hypothetical protein
MERKPFIFPDDVIPSFRRWWKHILAEQKQAAVRFVFHGVNLCIALFLGVFWGGIGEPKWELYAALNVEFYLCVLVFIGVVGALICCRSNNFSKWVMTKGYGLGVLSIWITFWVGIIGRAWPFGYLWFGYGVVSFILIPVYFYGKYAEAAEQKGFGARLW